MTLISKNSDLILAVKKALEERSSLNVESSLVYSGKVPASNLIIDVASLSLNTFAYFHSIFQNFISNVLFIVPHSIDDSIKKIVYAESSNVIPFPCEKTVLSFAISEFSKKNEVGKLFSSSIFREIIPVEILNAGFLGHSAAIRKLRQQIITMSGIDEPILLMGESGTGKSTAANVLHQLSKRRKFPFYPLNASTIPTNMLESTLFGTNQGAFTDAIKTDGLCAKGNKGTIFLDEITSMNINSQAKMNMLLDKGIYYRLGSDEIFKADIHFIFATNEDIGQKIMEGEFRKDLFFRMRENIIVFPQLKDRMEDIPLLAKAAVQSKGKLLSEEAIEKLYEYHWPGNVRQLQGCVINAAVKTEGDIIRPDDINWSSII